jgi:hypothetical protein
MLVLSRKLESRNLYENIFTMHADSIIEGKEVDALE